VLLRRAVVGLIVIGLLGGLVLAYGQGMFADRVFVTAVVDNAGGSLTAGSDVKSRGVIVGRVDSISSAGDGVRIGLQLDGASARKLPQSVQARVIPATVFGTTAVDLVVPEGAAESDVGLPPGHEIGQDLSSPTLELQDTLDDTDRVLSAVEPAKLATTLASIANALDGRGRELGGTIETLEGYLERLEPHLPLLQEDLRLAAIDLRVLADVSPDLLAAVDNSLPTNRTIVAKRQELATALTDAHELVETAEEFLSDQRKVILRTLANAAKAFDALFDHRAGLPEGFRSFIEFAERGSQAFSGGPFLRTDSEVHITTGGAVPYTAADCPQYGPVVGDDCGGDGATAGTADPQPPRLTVPGLLGPGLGIPGLLGPPAEETDPDTGLLGDIAGLLEGLGGAR
jgi:phospholipid/cholesterol/gamma-HCH transport system substrate-binding protein